MYHFSGVDPDPFSLEHGKIHPIYKGCVPKIYKVVVGSFKKQRFILCVNNVAQSNIKGFNMQRNEGLQVIKPLPTSVRESQKCGYVQKRINLNLKKKMSKRITAADSSEGQPYQLSPPLRDSQTKRNIFIVLIEY